MPNDIIVIIILMTGAYLTGSIPFGLLLCRHFYSIDLRLVGSGNTGATNAKRVGGWRLGLATLVFDMAKGAIPLGIGLFWFDEGGTLIARAGLILVALSAFLGHLYPIYLSFKTGGKGVSTAGGCFMVLSPVAFLVILAMFAVTTIISRRVSAGSLAAAATLPIAVYFAEKNADFVPGAIVFSLFIIMRHRDNIARLINNTEPRIY